MVNHPPCREGTAKRSTGRLHASLGKAAEQLLASSYAQLRRAARRLMRHERVQTLQATELVHEAYLRLVQQSSLEVPSQEVFVRLMALNMRRHLLDRARRRHAGKRGQGAVREDVDVEHLSISEDASGDGYTVLMMIDDSMGRLALAHPRAARVIAERVYAGRTVEEIATRLGVSSGTVKREFALGRAWLARELRS